MKKIKFLLTALLLSCSSMSFAQFTNNGSSSSIRSISLTDVPEWQGLRFSYDRTFMSVDVSNAEESKMNGFSLDYVHSFKIAKSFPIFLETGAGINFARWSDSHVQEDNYNNEYEENSSVTTLGLTIPVNVVYGIGITDKFSIKPYTGLYLRINLMGKGRDEFIVNGEKDPDYNFDYNLFDEDDMGGKDNTWNRAQIGWQIGTMFDINNFNIGITYGLDFNEISDRTKSSKFSVRCGLNF